MGDFFKIVAELGFPIAGAMAAGYFVFLTLKFILAGVTSSVNGMGGIIKGLDSRVDTMTNQLQRIDVKVSHALGLQPDYDRISRAEQADYDWDLYKDRIVLDRELDIDKLEWRAGDHFEIKNTNGRVELVKVDPVVKFVKGYK